MKKYCFTCDKDVTFQIIEKEVSTSIEDYNIQYLAKIPLCKNCGNEIYIGYISDQNIITANSKYREIAKIIQVSEIQALMGKYELDEEAMSSILGWEKSLLLRYLNGFTPSKLYSNQLKKLANQNIIHDG